MADLAALNAAVEDLQNTEADAVAALNDLSDKVAAGNSVSQGDIDAITAKLTGMSDGLKSAVAVDDPPKPADPQTNPDGSPFVPATNVDNSSTASIDNGPTAPADNGSPAGVSPAPESDADATTPDADQTSGSAPSA